MSGENNAPTAAGVMLQRTQGGGCWGRCRSQQRFCMSSTPGARSMHQPAPLPTRSLVQTSQDTEVVAAASCRASCQEMPICRWFWGDRLCADAAPHSECTKTALCHGVMGAAAVLGAGSSWGQLRDRMSLSSYLELFSHLMCISQDQTGPPGYSENTCLYQMPSLVAPMSRPQAVHGAFL